MEPKTRVAKVLNKPDNAPTVRHGTVESVDGDTLQVLIDNTASPITCARACVCVQGDRVVVVGKDAIATVGANYGGGGVSLQVVDAANDNISITGGSYSNQTVTPTIPAGYTVLGIVGASIYNATSGGTNGSHTVVGSCYWTGTAAEVRLKNTSTNASKVKVTVYFLCAG